MVNIADTVRLNFITLLNVDSKITIYRKEYQQEEVEDEEVFVYSLNQSSDDSEEDYIQYLISFQEREEYTKYVCSIWENNDLTLRWLYITLLSNLEAQKSDALLYSRGKRKFEKTIEFTVQKTDLGNQVITLSPYYLRNKKSFGFLIDFRFRTKDNVRFNKEVQKLSLSLDSHYKSNRNYYSDKHSIIRSFIDNKLSSLLPLQYDDLELNFNTDLTTLSTNKLENKKYIFGNNKTSPSQFQGVKSYGPFEQITDGVRYLFIFEDRFKSFGNDIFLSLAGKTNPGTFPGMDEMFKLPITIENVDRIKIDKLDVENLSIAVEEVKKYRDEHSSERVIAILLEENNEDDSEETKSPYYFLKFNLLKNNIPVQVLSKNRVGNANTLKWSTSNIGLQIFSKLGGIPWLVTPSNSNCLILGIGSAHKIDKETGNVNKYMAYSICLDSSGLYKKLSILSDTQNKDDYLSELKNNLISLLKEEDFSGYGKVVLHVPFKIKKDEINSIQEALNEMNDIEFKVIKVNVNNKFFGFSNHNTHVPYESSYVKLANNEYLVWFEGLQYGKEIVYQRVANPVHIKFLNFDSTSKEDDYPYLQDVLNLSGANWRGFNAKSIPISIYYSKLIAEYTKVFENFDGFDRDIFSTNKPWFL